MKRTPRLTPQATLLLVVLTGTLALLLEQPANLVALAGLAGLYWLLAPSRRYGLLVPLVLALGTWSIVVTQGLFYQGWPRTVLVTLVPGRWFPAGDPPGLHLIGEGLWYGLVQSLRLDVMVLLGAGLLGRFAADELASGLRALGLPPVAGFLFGMAMRHLPQMARELRTVWIAQRLRGYRPWAGDGVGAWTGAGALLVPVLAAGVRKADEIAAALQSRGWSADVAWPDAAARCGPWERAAVTGAATLVALLLVAFVLTRLHVAGVYSAPWLNALYVLVLHHV